FVAPDERLPFAILRDGPQAQEGDTNKHPVHVPVCKVKQVCGLYFLREELKRTTIVLSQVGLLGRKSAGMHFLRCLEQREQIPDLSQMFLYRCGTASFRFTGERDRHMANPRYPGLHKTFLMYLGPQEQISSHVSPTLAYWSAIINEMTSVMAINTASMLALHFRRRLHHYGRSRYAKKRVKFNPATRKSRSLLIAAILAKNSNILTQMETKLLQQKCGIHGPNRGLQKSVSYVNDSVWCTIRLRHALVDGWARREAPKNKRCSSVFDTITSGLFRTISSYTERVDFVKALFGRIYNDPVAKVFGSGYLGLECRSVTARSAWPLKNETVLRTIFNVNALKTKTRQLVTDIVEKGAFDLALDKLPSGYTPDILFGIDPGVRALATAPYAGNNSRRQRRRHHSRRRSAAEYYHWAKFETKRVWYLNLRKGEPTYDMKLKEMPSFKIAQLTTYVDRLRYFVEHVGGLVSFLAEKSFRKWRFQAKGSKMRAMTTIVRRLFPVRSAHVCIAFGWSSWKLKSYRKRELERWATVLPVDGFRTSKMGSCCHERLHPARLLMKKRKNSRCKAHVWNWDVNIYWMKLLKYMRLGLGRLAAFEP
ncbi:hypothetical protein GN958_ATG23352, partial [Phytophthora infestans]